jgi:hypothetical protein
MQQQKTIFFLKNTAADRPDAAGALLEFINLFYDDSSFSIASHLISFGSCWRLNHVFL